MSRYEKQLESRYRVYNNRNTYNFISLMKTQDEELLRNVAAFLYYAFQRRDNLT